MDTLFTILFETIVFLLLGISISYLIWKSKKGSKSNFGEFIDKYGYGIAIVSFIVISIVVATIKTLSQ